MEILPVIKFASLSSFVAEKRGNVVSSWNKKPSCLWCKSSWTVVTRNKVEEVRLYSWYLLIFTEQDFTNYKSYLSFILTCLLATSVSDCDFQLHGSCTWILRLVWILTLQYLWTLRNFPEPSNLKISEIFSKQFSAEILLNYRNLYTYHCSNDAIL